MLLHVGTAERMLGRSGLLRAQECRMRVHPVLQHPRCGSDSSAKRRWVAGTPHPFSSLRSGVPTCSSQSSANSAPRSPSPGPRSSAPPSQGERSGLLQLRGTDSGSGLRGCGGASAVMSNGCSGDNVTSMLRSSCVQDKYQKHKDIRACSDQYYLLSTFLQWTVSGCTPAVYHYLYHYYSAYHHPQVPSH